MIFSRQRKFSSLSVSFNGEKFFSPLLSGLFILEICIFFLFNFIQKDLFYFSVNMSCLIMSVLHQLNFFVIRFILSLNENGIFQSLGYLYFFGQFFLFKLVSLMLFEFFFFLLLTNVAPDFFSPVNRNNSCEKDSGTVLFSI